VIPPSRGSKCAVAPREWLYLTRWNHPLLKLSNPTGPAWQDRAGTPCSQGSPAIRVGRLQASVCVYLCSSWVIPGRPGRALSHGSRTWGDRTAAACAGGTPFRGPARTAPGIRGGAPGSPIAPWPLLCGGSEIAFIVALHSRRFWRSRTRRLPRRGGGRRSRGLYLLGVPA
jgi:hypothetical protein